MKDDDLKRNDSVPSTETRPLSKMLLVVDRKEGADPNLKLGWCITREVREELKERKAVDPYIFVVVCRPERDYIYQRYFFSMTDTVGLIQFNQPGKHRLHAVIVWPRKGAAPKDSWASDFSEMKRVLWRIEDFITYDGREINAAGTIRYSSAVQRSVEFCLASITSIDIEVADGFFAKEPHPWLSWFVDLWDEEPSRNECIFRRRLLVSTVPKLILLPPWILLRTTILIIWLLGAISVLGRGIFLKAFIPFKHSVRSLWGTGNGTLLSQDKDGRQRQWLFLPLTPLIWFFLYAFFSLGMDSVLRGFRVILFFLMFTYLACFVLYFGELILNKLILRKEAKKEVERAKREDKEMERLDKELSYIQCPATAAELGLTTEDLIRGRRTFHLWVTKTKAEICRPYAKR